MDINTGEKRRFNRVEKVLNVRMSDVPEETNLLDSYNCKCVNLSASGMLINVEKEFDIGRQFKILFLKPNTFYFFDGKAKVIRSEKSENDTFNIGIEFLNVDSTENKMMDYYINS